MVEGLIGRKVSMTQVFDQDGGTVPCTVLQAGPCIVVTRREAAKDGYEAVQLGLVEPGKARGVSKAVQGHFDDLGHLMDVGREVWSKTNGPHVWGHQEAADWNVNLGEGAQDLDLTGRHTQLFVRLADRRSPIESRDCLSPVSYTSSWAS